jgi:hypothetical protein
MGAKGEIRNPNLEIRNLNPEMRGKGPKGGRFRGRRSVRVPLAEGDGKAESGKAALLR